MAKPGDINQVPLSERSFELEHCGVRFASDHCDFRNGVTVTSDYQPLDDGSLLQAVAAMIDYHRSLIAGDLPREVNYSAVKYTVVR